MPMPKKMPIIAVIEKGNRAKSCNSNITYSDKEDKHFPGSSAIPCGTKKATALLEQWIKDDVFIFQIDFLPTVQDQKDLKYYPYRQKKEHSLEQAFTSKKVFL